MNGLTRSLAVLVCVLSALVLNATQARAAEEENANRAPATREARNDSPDNDEYNFSWLDPDKKVYVLQNRRYRKAWRPEIFLSGGFNLNSPFRTAYAFAPRASFHFSEQLGVEVFYANIWNKDNDTFTALRAVSASALPFVREIHNYFGGLVTWTPWYATLNFFNKILYFDWALNAGLGQVYTTVDLNNKAAGTPIIANESFLAYYFGTSQNYYLTNHFTIRLDLVGMAFSAKGADYSTQHTYTNFDFMTGLGFLF